VHHQGPLRDVLSEVYRPALQKSGLTLTIVARAANPAAVAPSIAAQVGRASERALPGRIATFASMNDQYKDDARHRAILLGLLGGIGIVLAAVGVFGLTSYSVTQRTREIGLRVALGATGGQVIRSVVGALLPFIAGGIALGLFGAWGATRVVAEFLFGVTPTDRPTFAVVTVLLAAVAIAACYIPARRALWVDPVTALRAE
jgi:putative ABC transport system permease protein